MSAMTGPAAYRSRVHDVEAIRWVGEDNCEPVFAFVGLEHPGRDEELDHSELHIPTGPDDYVTAHHGDWIIRDGEDGRFTVYSDAEFGEEFDPVSGVDDPLTVAYEAAVRRTGKLSLLTPGDVAVAVRHVRDAELDRLINKVADYERQLARQSTEIARLTEDLTGALAEITRLTGGQRAATAGER